ncbi:hypothetical protein Hanom_Chr06g00509001 [Helianthus anomalus]
MKTLGILLRLLVCNYFAFALPFAPIAPFLGVRFLNMTFLDHQHWCSLAGYIHLSSFEHLMQLCKCLLQPIHIVVHSELII